MKKGPGSRCVISLCRCISADASLHAAGCADAHATLRLAVLQLTSCCVVMIRVAPSRRLTASRAAGWWVPWTPGNPTIPTRTDEGVRASVRHSRQGPTGRRSDAQRPICAILRRTIVGIKWHYTPLPYADQGARRRSVKRRDRRNHEPPPNLGRKSTDTGADALPATAAEAAMCKKRHERGRPSGETRQRRISSREGPIRGALIEDLTSSLIELGLTPFAPLQHHTWSARSSPCPVAGHRLAVQNPLTSRAGHPTVRDASRGAPCGARPQRPAFSTRAWG